RAVVQIMHGLGDHAGRYAHVAAALNSAGYSAYVPDQRGHGRTGVKQFGGDLSKLGKLGPGGFRAAVADFTELTNIIRAENPGVPIVLLGHSMGSLMGQVLINDHAADYAAVVFSGSAYRQPGSMNAGKLNKKFDAPGCTGHEWLSRDPAVWKAFKEDPWTFEADTLKLYGLADGLRLFGKPAKDMAQVPLLLIVGEDDTLGGKPSNIKLAESYIERAGQTDVTLGIYPEARHEIFNETNKEEVLDDMISWISERVAS
ncbi:MAG: alpha/beta hydrolase, partial [Actinomycetales bacterium]|nr:alpha/beta hydrolase [Actinomycetales bacterium]